MGCWGAGLYENDDSCQTRDDFIHLIKSGLSSAEATQDILDSHSDLIGDLEVELPIVLALAETQWKYGRVIDSIRQRAIEIISNGGDLDLWERDSPDSVSKRKRVLNLLKKKLEQSPPEEKYIKPLSLAKKRSINLFPQGKIGYIYSVEVADNKFCPFILIEYGQPSKDLRPVFCALPYLFSKQDFSVDSIPYHSEYIAIETGLGPKKIFAHCLEVGRSYFNTYKELGPALHTFDRNSEGYPVYKTSRALLAEIAEKSQFIK
ncbi:MAG: hypothetical protein AAGC78_00165 [Cellvibrio sp.]|uniref:hypothetical protein n=1 Tax=Cellvibrio sp. TaxID=1965322 RepID=UPI0031B1EE0A